ncbi:MAG: hypothetical protein ABEN55_20365 [Bradymonadaceae bacterium]
MSRMHVNVQWRDFEEETPDPIDDRDYVVVTKGGEIHQTGYTQEARDGYSGFVREGSWIQSSEVRWWVPLNELFEPSLPGVDADPELSEAEMVDQIMATVDRDDVLEGLRMVRRYVRIAFRMVEKAVEKAEGGTGV